MLKENSLNSFIYPKNPENICLLKDEEIWLETISHEDICIIHGDEEDKVFLENIGILCDEEEKFIKKVEKFEEDNIEEIENENKIEQLRKIVNINIDE